MQKSEPMNRSAILIDLANQLRNGDIRAFEKIYEIKVRDIYFIALQILGNEQDSLEAVQDIFLQAYQNIGKLRNPEFFSTWLFRIAINTCRSKLKAKVKMNYMVDVLESIETVRDDSMYSYPEEYLMQTETREKVLRSVQKLSLEQKEVILMYYFESMNINDISKVLGISTRATLGRLSRARKAIKTDFSSETGEAVLFGGVSSTGILGTILCENARHALSPANVSSLWSGISSVIASPVTTTAVVAGNLMLKAGIGLLSATMIGTGALLISSRAIPKSTDPLSSSSGTEQSLRVIMDPSTDLSLPSQDNALSISGEVSTVSDWIETREIPLVVSAPISESPAAATPVSPNQPNRSPPASSAPTSSAPVSSAPTSSAPTPSAPTPSSPTVEYTVLSDFIGEADAAYILVITPKDAFFQRKKIDSIYTRHGFSMHIQLGDTEGVPLSSYYCRKLYKGNRRLLFCEKVDYQKEEIYFAYEISERNAPALTLPQLEQWFGEHVIP